MDQRYAMIVLADGGPDLEAFAFDRQLSWIQAAGIFWQITDALARAEKWAQFEVSCSPSCRDGSELMRPASRYARGPSPYQSGADRSTFINRRSLGSIDERMQGDYHRFRPLTTQYA